jgi:hypothetical protein
MRRLLLLAGVMLAIASPSFADTITIDSSTPWGTPPPWAQGGGRYSYITVGDFQFIPLGIWFYRAGGIADIFAGDDAAMMIRRTDGQPFTPVSASYFQSSPGPTSFTGPGNGVFAGPALIVLPTDSSTGTVAFGAEWSDITSMVFAFAYYYDPNADPEYPSSIAHLSLRSFTVVAPAATVPEPTIGLLLAASLGGVLAQRRRRRKGCV